MTRHMKGPAGRHAIVCGSTRGIGQACARRLATDGATVTLIARDEEALQRVRRDLDASAGQTHRILAADFTQWQDLEVNLEQFLDEHGPVHVLINNTGGPPAGPASEAEPQAYLDAFTQHLIVNQVLLRAVLPGMRTAGYGRVINIISTSVVTPIQGLGVSNTIRGAVANWAKTLAGELGPHGITINNVLPGFTETDRLRNLIAGRAERSGRTVAEVEEQMASTVPARRFASPDETAAAVAFLASEEAGYISGVNLPVDGGRLAVQ